MELGRTVGLELIPDLHQTPVTEIDLQHCYTYQMRLLVPGSWSSRFNQQRFTQQQQPKYQLDLKTSRSGNRCGLIKYRHDARQGPSPSLSWGYWRGRLRSRNAAALITNHRSWRNTSQLIGQALHSIQDIRAYVTRLLSTSTPVDVPRMMSADTDCALQCFWTKDSTKTAANGGKSDTVPSPPVHPLDPRPSQPSLLCGWLVIPPGLHRV
ncbi:hypothetical protein V8C44DRAFT_5828 [Trichoderma aethiopicum]